MSTGLPSRISKPSLGDTVNLASRMESHGLPDTIQVTSGLIEHLQGRYPFERRGYVEVKGKRRRRNVDPELQMSVDRSTPGSSGESREDRCRGDRGPSSDLPRETTAQQVPCWQRTSQNV